jgi:hypothetical protein
MEGQVVLPELAQPTRSASQLARQIPDIQIPFLKLRMATLEVASSAV